MTTGSSGSGSATLELPLAFVDLLSVTNGIVFRKQGVMPADARLRLLGARPISRMAGWLAFATPAARLTAKNSLPASGVVELMVPPQAVPYGMLAAAG